MILRKSPPRGTPPPAKHLITELSVGTIEKTERSLLALTCKPCWETVPALVLVLGAACSAFARCENLQVRMTHPRAGEGERAKNGTGKGKAKRSEREPG
jgi:hypothetical protein